MKPFSLLLTCTLAGLALLAGVFIFFPDQQSSAGAIEPIDAEYVCMVNDRYFDTPQIEVPVGDKMYYGCCQGCVAALKNEPGTRTATDPVTGKEVDKATATIGALSDGTVRYFESEETLAQYSSSTETE